MVRAKFKCWKAEKVGESESVQLGAVTSGGDDDPNKSWAKYTPAGGLSMTIDNPAAQGFFVEGREYFIDFAPAE